MIEVSHPINGMLVSSLESSVIMLRDMRAQALKHPEIDYTSAWDSLLESIANMAREGKVKHEGTLAGIR